MLHLYCQCKSNLNFIVEIYGVIIQCIEIYKLQIHDKKVCCLFYFGEVYDTNFGFHLIDFYAFTVTISHN